MIKALRCFLFGALSFLLSATVICCIFPYDLETHVFSDKELRRIFLNNTNTDILVVESAATPSGSGAVFHLHIAYKNPFILKQEILSSQQYGEHIVLKIEEKADAKTHYYQKGRNFIVLLKRNEKGINFVHPGINLVPFTQENLKSFMSLIEEM